MIHLSSAVSSIVAAKEMMRVHSNNLSNAETNSFRAEISQMTDNIYVNKINTNNQIVGAGDVVTPSPIGLNIGSGSKVVGNIRNLSEGELYSTNNPIDLYIKGQSGYFQVLMPNNKLGYTRNGGFTINKDRKMVHTASGMELSDDITVPDDVEIATIAIDENGFVTGKNNDDEIVQLGRVTLWSFDNQQGLVPEGRSIFSETESSGGSTQFNPGDAGKDMLQSGYLERSNVEKYDELLKFMDASSLMQISSQVIQIASKAEDSIITNLSAAASS